MSDLRFQHDARVEQALNLVGEIRPLLRQRYTALQKKPVEPTQADLHHMERILSLLGEVALQLGVYLDADEAVADLGVAVRGDVEARSQAAEPRDLDAEPLPDSVLGLMAHVRELRAKLARKRASDAGK